MKKIWWLVFFCSLLLGCKKNPFDYRAKYTGEYVFSVHSVSWNIMQGVTLDTTYSHNGRVEIDSEENTILISNSAFIIYEDGTLEGEECKGEFESTKKISYSCNSGGLCGGSYHTVTGEKR